MFLKEPTDDTLLSLRMKGGAGFQIFQTRFGSLGYGTRNLPLSATQLLLSTDHWDFLPSFSSDRSSSGSDEVPSRLIQDFSNHRSDKTKRRESDCPESQD